jgi:hypothetical protein
MFTFHRLELRDPIAEPRHEIGRRLDRREISDDEKSATDSQIMTRAPNATLHVPMHRFHLNAWKYVIDEADVILSKCATIHQSGLVASLVRVSVPERRDAVPELLSLFPCC